MGEQRSEFVTTGEWERYLERLGQERAVDREQTKAERAEFRAEMLRAINALEKTTADGFDRIAEKQDKTNGRVLFLEREFTGFQRDYAALNQSVQEHHAQSVEHRASGTAYSSMVWAAFLGAIFTGGVTIAVALLLKLKPS